MANALDLSGQRFGYLTAIERDGSLYGKAAWRCRCDCGEMKTLASTDLRTERVKSCGCRRNEMIGNGTRSHGQSGSDLYGIWNHIKNRVTNESSEDYPNYGGRGISMDPEWYGSFETFAKDVGDRPSPLYSIDRKDVDGDYEPGNVKWSTKTEQQRNKRNNVIVSYQGQDILLIELAEKTRLSYSSLYYRIVTNGESAEESVAFLLKSK